MRGDVLRTLLGVHVTQALHVLWWEVILVNESKGAKVSVHAKADYDSHGHSDDSSKGRLWPIEAHEGKHPGTGDSDQHVHDEDE